jgi:opacity protein-like surface antigen
MFNMAKPSLAAALIAFAGLPAYAADIIEPPIVEAPPPVIEPVAEFGGWYIRGDIDYHWSDLRGTEYITYGVDAFGNPLPGTSSFDTAELDGAWSLGAGVGYQITRYLRADLTADYWFSADFNGSTTGVCNGVVCTSTDTSSYSAWLLLANAYVDLGTYHGFTPYVGAGIGGAYVKWDDLHNTIGPDTIVHEGSSNWRFAWALMAGTSYCLTNNLKLDVGYRYTNINGGRMFELAPTTGPGAGPGFDDGFNVHEARAGLRYDFGPGGTCYEPEPIAYEPPPEQPIYK